MRHFEIPKFLDHLPVNEKGYPIPYFVAIVDGKPDFRLLDSVKQLACINGKKCGVCGKTIPNTQFYFVSGYFGYLNSISTDPGMHRECAEFSLVACPHMHFKKAERREEYDEGVDVSAPAGFVDTKPDKVYLIRATNYKAGRIPGSKNITIQYKAMNAEEWIYEGNILVRSGKKYAGTFKPIK